MKDLDIALAGPFQDSQGNGDWFQRRAGGGSDPGLRRLLVLPCDGEIRIAQLARVRIVLNQVDALAEAGFVLGRKRIRDRLTPRVNEPGMEIQPVSRVF